MNVSATGRAELHACATARACTTLLAGTLLACASLFPCIAISQVGDLSVPTENRAVAQAKLRQQRAARFLAGRQASRQSVNPSAARQAATAQHLAIVSANAVLPLGTPLTATWQSVGPAQINSESYGLVSGRISSIAIDSSDASGNTVYLGTTGGGVWKSTNAAGAAGSVTFNPLTDDLSVYSISSGSSATASLSIGAVSVQPGGTGVVLAGTGDPNDALDSYYGEGILRSRDGGQTWSLIQNSHDGVAGTHSFIGNGFAGFAWSSTTSGVVVAAVSQAAEGVVVNAPVDVYSIQGLYYSTDSGQTWQMATISDGSQMVQSAQSNFSGYFGNPVTAVIWNPVRQRFYAAVRYHGYYESANGSTWTRLANQPGSNLTTSNCPVNANQPGSIACPIFRGALAVDATTGDTFALTVDANNNNQGLWRDVCNLTSGQCASSTEVFGTQLNSTPLGKSGSTIISQADYDLYLAAVHSGTDTLLFAGTEDIYRCSLNAGCSFRNTTNAYSCAAAMVAPAQHAMDVIAADGPLIYFGNDGGLWRSSDGVNQQAAVCSADDATHFTNLNSGVDSLAEVVSLAAHPSDTTQMLVGVGANGSAASDGSAKIWQQVSSGEGGGAAIDASNPLNYFISTSSGVNINSCALGESCTAANFATTPQIGATQVDDDESLMDAPYLLDPALTSQLILGTCRVWRGAASGGNAWSASDVLSPMLDGVNNSFCNGNALVRSLGAGGPLVARAGSQVLYAGMAGELDGGGIKSGHLFSTMKASTANAGTLWSDLYSNAVSNDTANSGKFNPGNFDISSIAVDPHDASGNTVYATVMGFSGNAYSVPHVYMSTTGGTSWTNISSNLPNAPANAVLVDPNDANTVYVAMDTGVYVTQAVSTCSTATVNCWNVFGVGLPNAPVTQMAAIAQSGSSMLAVGTYGRGVWQLPLASTLPATAVTLTPGSLTFTSQTTGTSSSAQSISVMNSGSTELQIKSVSVSGEFSETDNCTAAPIAGGGSCTVNIIFTPTTTGTLMGTLTITGNISGGSVTAGLSGLGAAPPAPAITFSPTSLSFTPLNVGSTSPAQGITVTNSGNAALSITQVSLQGDFSETDNCTAAPIPVNGNCVIEVEFTPLVAGPLSGTVTLSANVSGGTATASFSGTGVGIGVLNPTPQYINFGTIDYQTPSTAQTIVLQNTGTAPVTISTLTMAGNFSETDNCADTTLAINATCSVQVIFTPASFGNISGSLTVNSNASNSPTGISLTGFGIGLTDVTVSLTPNSLTFAPQAVAAISPAQSITLAVTSTSTLNPPTISITGDFSETDNCYTYVYGTHTCTISVTFTPTTTGLRTGMLSVAGNIQNGPVTASLSGTGINGPLVTNSPSNLQFGSVNLGASSATQSVVLSNIGNSTATLNAPSISGDYSIVTSTCGSTLAAAGNCTINIEFTPTQSGTRTGQISIGNNGTGGTVTTTFSGTGVEPSNVSLAPTSLVFSNQTVGTSSAAQGVIVSNTGGSVATLGTPQIDGDFIISANTCGSTLAVAASCSLAVEFSPTAIGTRSGQISISGGSSGTLSASLSGVGVSQADVTLAPASLSFANTTIGANSAALNVIATNIGGSTATLGIPQISGDFSISTTTCGSTLAAAANCSISIVFTPTAAGTRSGQISMSTSGTVASVSASLSGTGYTAADVTMTPTTLTFAGTNLGASSTAQILVVQNSGGTTATLGTPKISGDFSISANSCTTSLAASASCNISVVFTPTATGTRSGQISISTSGTVATVVASLSGNGVALPNVGLTPMLLSFPNTNVGATSAAQNIVVANTGGSTATLSAPQISGDFSISTNTCSTSLTAQNSCTISIEFSPTASGSRTGIFQIGSSSGTLSASLSGIGLSAATDTLSTTTLTFAAQEEGTVSAAQTVTLTNSGDTSLGNLTAQITSGDFSLVSGCGSSLAGHSSCSVNVSYAPKSVGSEVGVLTLGDALHSQTVALSGTGLAPPGVSLLPSAGINYGVIGVGQSSAVQSVTLTNNGGVALLISGINISGAGDFTIPSGGNTCPTSLGASTSCTLQIMFTPVAAGTRSAQLNIVDNAAGGSQSLLLSGTGLDFSMNASGSTTQTVSSGQQAVYNILLTPGAAGLSNALSFACTGAPTDAKCVVTTNPGSPTLAGNVNITVTVSTGVNPNAQPGVVVAVALAPLAWLAFCCGRRKKKLAMKPLVWLVLLIVMMAGSGCGSGGRLIPQSTSSGSSGTGTGTVVYATPSGNYVLQLTGSAAGVTHAVSLTLVVQ